MILLVTGAADAGTVAGTESRLLPLPRSARFWLLLHQLIR
jgi:hypothetical protein